MKIGLVGEAPNDTIAIQNLLSKQYKDLNFVTLLERITGAMLDSSRSLELLRKEYLSQKPDLIIFIRDLDALENGKSKLVERTKKFKASNRIVENNGILLLNIYELEALILADINTFNKHYGCSITIEDPMKVTEPKEFLIKATRSADKRFSISHNPHLFSLLKFNVVKANCRYFASFLDEFEAAIAS